MELLLTRTYHRGGTNGVLCRESEKVCCTIELPWRENIIYFSCIPEGRYLLEKRYSAKHGYHLLVRGVPGRSLILIHPANDATHQLQGCIAPVTTLTGEGKGEESREAFDKLLQLVYKRLDNREPVWLEIVSTGAAVQPAIVKPLVIQGGLQLCA